VVKFIFSVEPSDYVMLSGCA